MWGMRKATLHNQLHPELGTPGPQQRLGAGLGILETAVKGFSFEHAQMAWQIKGIHCGRVTSANEVQDMSGDE